MKKFSMLFLIVLVISMAGYLMAGSPQGGYMIWHQTGGHGQRITVDQVGCMDHLFSHPGDAELAPVPGGNCGFEDPQ